MFCLLCLAEFLKYQGRCLARVRLDNGVRIRSVSANGEQGVPFEKHCAK
ncbi:hypothetical protein [Candidatus Caldatribacterium sp.]|nr:hypothetical protein [Candidatus Caldatribacterium sp.]MDW8082106.1 hypothetical protein [Candidatus Calescibacterium sp.]